MHFQPIEQRDSKLPMSAMIDIVFLLLIFFVMTFQIVVPESDLEISAPTASEDGPSPLQLPHIIKLNSDRNGELVGLRLNDEPLTDLGQLRRHVRSLVEDSSGDDIELIVECDTQLNYRHAVDALTAVSGYVGDDGRIVPLARNVRLARLR